MDNEKLSQNVKKILVVEDNTEYLNQIKDVFARRNTSGLQIDVTYATNLEQATSLIASNNYDGIMSDVVFPDAEGLEEKINGCNVAQQAFDKGTPVVLVTSTYHHDGKTQPACKWARARNFDLVDNYDGKTKGKNFVGALLSLGYIIEASKEAEGILEIVHSGYKEGPKFQHEGFYSAKSVIGFANNINGDSLHDDFSDCGLFTYMEKKGKISPLFKKAAESYCAGLLPESPGK